MLRFLLLDLGEAGRHSDGGVLSNSAFGEALEEGLLSIPERATIPGIKNQLMPCSFRYICSVLLPNCRYNWTTISL